MFDVQAIIRQFPILSQEVNGHPLAFLDSAASTQKPEAVLQAMDSFYRRDNANVHRGVYTLSERATHAYEESRRTVARFINAAEDEIVFTKGCTEGVNLLAHCLGPSVKPGDTILVSLMEHHANLVPWQVVAKVTGAKLVPIPVNSDGTISLESYATLVKSGAKIVAIKHVCNAFGTVNPVQELIRLARENGAVTVVDGAQALAHVPVNVRDLYCDFYVGSSHKVYGPMGTGFVYGRGDIFRQLPPYQTGGDMIERVTFNDATYAETPGRLEAGTPNVAGAIGFAAALTWFETLDREIVWEEEHKLRIHAEQALSEIPGVNLHGSKENRIGIVSFTCDFAHPHDIATILDQHGVAVRSGHHCCMPLMERLNLPGTVRASLGVYNTKQDIKSLTNGLINAREIFA